MKITAKLITLIAFILVLASCAIPGALGQRGSTFYAFWIFGLVFSGKDGRFSWIGGEGNLWAIWSPILMVTLALVCIHLGASLLSKNADKRLNRTVAGDIGLATGIIFFVGMYLGLGLYSYAVPLGLIVLVIGGGISIWAGRLTRAEASPR